MPDFNFKKLTLQGFRSFIKPQVFVLSREHGLYYITGENKVDTELGSNGAGKAQPLTEKVLTPTGWKLMREINVGDKIIGVDGKAYDVTETISQGSKEVYKFTFTDGSTTRCCGDHLWDLKVSIWHKYKGIIIRTKHLMLAELRDKCKQKHYKFYVPLIKNPVKFEQPEIPSINPYILGVLLGDGGITETASFTNIDQEIIDYIKYNIPDNYKLTKRGKISYCITKRFKLERFIYDQYKRKDKNRQIHVPHQKWLDLTKNSYVEYLRKLKLFGLKSEAKFIPDCYKFGSIETRLELLRGLFDTDGSAETTSVSYPTKSKQLALDVIEVVQSFGGTATLNERWTTCKGKKFHSYRLYIKLPKEIIPFKLKRKIKDYNITREVEPMRAIESIVPDGVEECKCIVTNSPRNLYVTSSYVLTHNSSTVDSLVWTLFGYTIRGVKGVHLKSWSEKTVKVSLFFSKDNVDHLLIRTHTPISLILDEQPITQEELDSFLGITYEQFLASVVIGQLASSFLDLSPTEKLNFFSVVMSLDYWERCSSIADKIAKETELNLSELNGKQTTIKSELELLASHLAELKQDNYTYEDNQKVKIVKLVKEQTDELEEVKKLEILELDQHKQVRVQENDILGVTSSIEKELDNLESLSRDSHKISEKLASIKSTIQSFKDSFTKWKSLKDKCPYCEQSVDPSLITTEKSKLVKLISKHQIDHDLYQKELINIQNLQLGVTKEIDQLKVELTTTQTSLKSLQNILASLTSQRELKLANVKRIRISKEELEKQINPYTKLIENVNNSILLTTKELADVEGSIQEQNRSYEGYGYWGSKGFKELRLWLIEDALHSFEIESNNALTKLGLSSWVLKFVIEKETSTKTISKGFHVFVNSTSSPNGYVPLEVWSGGELQRLKLATIIGLASLIQNYKGFSSNIEVWDEPSSHLSEEGIDNLINFLYEYSTSNNKTIYFIDHNSLSSPYFKSVIKVTKDIEGSTISE